ncbi:MAG: glycosyltransferase family 2 protein [Flavobacterium sp.]
MTSIFTRDDFEILVATMNRTSLDFLHSMFPHTLFSEYAILIINQTTEGSLLQSDYPNIRVVNSVERGLSKSRNLALQYAKGKIVLIADDDVIYHPDFEITILNAFEKLNYPSVITFNHQRIGAIGFHKKFQKEFLHTSKSILGVSSIEIAFLLEDIKKNDINFDEQFGLGAFFETAEEFLFLRKVLDAKLRTYFSPAVIVSHPLLSSGVKEGSDELIYARSALFYKLKGVFGYLWLMKYLFFLLRNRYINPSQLYKKLEKGLEGIEKYRELKSFAHDKSK